MVRLFIPDHWTSPTWNFTGTWSTNVQPWIFLLIPVAAVVIFFFFSFIWLCHHAPSCHSREFVIILDSLLSSMPHTADSLEKTLMLGKMEGKRKRAWQRMRCLDSITNSMDMNLGKLWEIETESPGMLHGVSKSWTRLNNNAMYNFTSLQFAC